METGHAEILPSGMTEKKSIPEPQRRRDALPERRESITRDERDYPRDPAGARHLADPESTSEVMPELYVSIQLESPASDPSPASQNMLKLSCQWTWSNSPVPRRWLHVLVDVRPLLDGHPGHEVPAEALLS